MSDEKKAESPAGGPVVVRKGHVRPPPPGTPIERPVEEPLDPGAAAPAVPDGRPLWQRVADQAAGRGAPSAPPSAPSGARPGPRSDRPRGARPGPGRPGPGRPQGGRPRGDRPREERPNADRAARETGPRLPEGEPPPAPEAPVEEEGSFADLLAQGGDATRSRRRFQPGEKVAGKIIQIGDEVTFLDLGSGLADGLIDTVELRDEEGHLSHRDGDILDAVVVKGGDRGVQVSLGRARAATRDHAREAVVEAAHTGLPVEGLVKGVNKGGLEVEVHGVRAFCPMSQIDVRFVGDPATLVGQKLQFRVQKADERDCVLSRRALLEEERAAKARATREKLAVGAVLDGVVTSVQDYGAFVDLGGVEGLVHVSELAWDRVSRPQDLLSAGDAVQVQVLRIDEDPKKGARIGLSIKALAPRPEPKGEAPRPERPAPPPPPRVGDVLEASVDKIEPFGLFVRFAGGRGLVPASETGTPRGADLRRAFKVGDELKVQVIQIDEQGRFRLSKAGAEAAAERADAEAWMDSSRKKAPAGKGFGTLGDLLKSKLDKS